jgi:cytochrome c oxidase cbb3-type subunit 2
MNHGVLIFLGSLLTMALSWYGMVIGPTLQLGSAQQVVIETTGAFFPPARAGLAQQGREIYRANGCNHCHTQQVRPAGFGSDFERGWGSRPSVGRDYLLDNPVMLGTQRIGQDLSNAARRQTNEIWHFTHLYNPQSVSAGSVMPPYRYLFDKRKINGGGQPSSDAVVFDGKSGVEAGYEIVPKREARALVAYLMSLESETPVFEAPPLLKPKSAAGGNPAAGSPTNTSSGSVPVVK